jgi:LPS-assembly lipoprotein
VGKWIIVVALFVSACGFQLRGAFSLPFDTLFIAQSDTSELRAVLKRNIEASTQTRIVDDAKQAQATLAILLDTPQKNILSLSSAGRVREFQLVRIFSFRVVDAKGQEFVPPSMIRVSREITFDDTRILSKDTEEALLWRDIQNDLAQQLVRRLAAAKLRPTE